VVVVVSGRPSFGFDLPLTFCDHAVPRHRLRGLLGSLGLRGLLRCALCYVLCH
jgi:hypothetical protein